MSAIGYKDVRDLASESFDIIVVGGGIHGAMIHLEACRQRLRSLLIEESDFGGATTHNTLRIIHGGLRYLQNLDLRRSWESTGERQWYLNRMQPLVTNLPCLIPLYGEGMRRASVMRLGLRLNSWVSWASAVVNDFSEDSPRGHVLDRRATIERVPIIDNDHLQGAGRWYDLQLLCPQRVVMEALRWAGAMGGSAANYTKAQDLLVTSNRVRGIAVIDRRTASSHELQADIVVNATGPWVRQLSQIWDRDLPELFTPSVGWNILFNRPALSDHALAVQHKTSSKTASNLFITRLNDKLLVGTGHAPLKQQEHDQWQSVVDSNLDEFIASINGAIPNLELDRSDIIRVFSGVLPVERPGTTDLRNRNVIKNHARHGGPKGLFSVSGIKFTTARAVARNLVEQLLEFADVRYRKRNALPYPAVSDHSYHAIFTLNKAPLEDDTDWQAPIKQLIEDEAVVHLDDLILRRTNLGDNPEQALALAPALCTLNDAWKRNESDEIQRVASILVKSEWPASVPESRTSFC